MFNNRRQFIGEIRHLQDRKQTEHRRDYIDADKQYVRKHGWIPAAKKRLSKIEGFGKTHLKYFTLCAGNAIDVWFFYLKENLIDYDKRGFPNVVFCERIAEEYEKIGRGLKRTRGYRANFEDLILERATDDSIDFFSQLPFDVYNLDFSGLCFPKTEPPFSNTLDSIVTLIENLGQSEYQPGFDIFFTFRAQRSEENEVAIRELRNNIRENRRNLPKFNELINNKYGEKLEKLSHNYHDFLLISLPKYLGRIGNETGFKVSITHRFYYPRPNLERPEYHIISFGLCFDWIGRDINIRRGVCQPVPKHEITTEAYHKMMMQLISNGIPNVAATIFPRDDYLNEVQQLLQIVDDNSLDEITH